MGVWEQSEEHLALWGCLWAYLLVGELFSSSDYLAVGEAGHDTESCPCLSRITRWVEVMAEMVSRERSLP